MENGSKFLVIIEWENTTPMISCFRNSGEASRLALEALKLEERPGATRATLYKKDQYDFCEEIEILYQRED